MRNCVKKIYLKINLKVEGEPLDMDDIYKITRAFKVHFADLNGNIANQKENILDCAVCSYFDSDSCDCIKPQ